MCLSAGSFGSGHMHQSTTASQEANKLSFDRRLSLLVGSGEVVVVEGRGKTGGPPVGGAVTQWEACSCCVSNLRAAVSFFTVVQCDHLVGEKVCTCVCVSPHTHRCKCETHYTFAMICLNDLLMRASKFLSFFFFK